MTEKLQNALNEQITAELWSANLYLSMSFYLEREGFSGMARWMQKQSAEETGHAYAIAGYMIKREATPKPPTSCPTRSLTSSWRNSAGRPPTW